MKVIKSGVVIAIAVASTSFMHAQETAKQQTVKVEIIENAFMCPNLKMKMNRTLIQRKADIQNWKVADDFNSASFTTENMAICNKDSIVKIFVKESEFPLHIFKSIQIGDLVVYKKNK